MKNIHLLPTDKPSRLIRLSNGELRYNENSGLHSFYPQNIYITNSEEIKEGDWCYQVELNDGKVDKCYDVTLYHTWTNNGVDKTRKFKKIILTTDQDLIADGVQAIDDYFLEWFVKNPSCEEVEVEELCGGCGSNDGDCWRSKECNKGYFKDKYKIIIPKKNFYCGDKFDYDEQCLEQCENCVDKKGIDYGYLTKQEPKQSIKDRIISETSEEIKQKARDYGNFLVNTKQETININKNTHYVDFSNPNADKISSASTTTINQETLKESGEYQQELFNYLYDLGVTALQSEMQYIERIVLGMQKETTFEEEAKQETLEQVTERYSGNQLSKLGFIEGAKWQEQQTIEEVFEWLTTNNYLTDLKETLIENFKNR